MGFSEILKLFAIVGTVVGGVYGTVFDFKKNGRVTRHGKLAIAGIAVAGLIAIVIQVNDSIDADQEQARLAQENDRQQRILKTSLQVNADTKAALAELQNVRSAVAESTRELTQQLEQQQAVAKDIREAVAAGSAETAANLNRVQAKIADADAAAGSAFNRLAKPIRSISFSYLLVFQEADRQFPRYYAQLEALARSADGISKSEDGRRLYLIDPPHFAGKRDAEAGTELQFEISNLVVGKQLSPDRFVAHRQYDVRAWSEQLESAVTGDFAPGTFQTMPPGDKGRAASVQLFVDLDQRSITKCVLFAAVRQLSNDGTLVGEEDLLRPAQPDQLALNLLRGAIGNRRSYLAEIAVHLHDGRDGTVRIPGKTCKRDLPGYDGRLTQCPFTRAVIGEFKCPENSRIQHLTLDQMTAE
jgi:hypothetical protein